MKFIFNKQAKQSYCNAGTKSFKMIQYILFAAFIASLLLMQNFLKPDSGYIDENFNEIND